jgi:DNA-3-methyladenine glycosylase
MGTLHGPRVISRAFFGRAPEVVAPELLGCVLTGGGVSVRLTEVEAYSGALDSASHAYRGRTERNAVMFGPPGFVYVYFTYGMHFCMNLVCLEPGVAGAVLLRAGEVVSGSSVAAARRGRSTDLARGPARLCQALGVDRSFNGVDVCSAGPLSLVRGSSVGPVLSGPRTGISTAREVPWRFWVDGESSVSPYRAHVPRSR